MWAIPERFPAGVPGELFALPGPDGMAERNARTSRRHFEVDGVHSLRHAVPGLFSSAGETSMPSVGIQRRSKDLASTLKKATPYCAYPWGFGFRLSNKLYAQEVKLPNRGGRR